MSIAPKNTEPTNEANIASLLVSLTRSLYRTMRSASPNCSFLEMKTLTIVHEQKSPSMKDIADELGISSPATTAVIDKLIENNEVTRLEDKDDRRIIRISLTTQGKKSFDKNRSVFYDAINGKASVLSTKEQTELARILQKLQDNSITK